MSYHQNLLPDVFQGLIGVCAARFVSDAIDGSKKVILCMVVGAQLNNGIHGRAELHNRDLHLG